MVVNSLKIKEAPDDAIMFCLLRWLLGLITWAISFQMEKGVVSH